MSIPKLKRQFLEVSDVLELGNPSIIEKDYWVVSLLAMLENVESKHHQLVFSGGTALAKSNIKILRMSEDVDIKLIPTQEFLDKSNGVKRKIRKALVEYLIAQLVEHPYLNYSDKSVNDNYRYVEIEIEYPQQYHQAPCLRPYIKLEFIETIELQNVEFRSISSLVAQSYKLPVEVNSISCISIDSTLVEKVLSMLRRTMSVKRDSKRKDDETLVRHIYDVHCITTEHEIDIDVLKPIFDIVLEEDKRRYGTQHQEFVDNPRNELKLGLVELETNVEFRNRFDAFVAPMVYSSEPCDFDTCFNSFKDISEQLIG
ncbi:nucleotidyl transferase AbiEii/AbiGii toxin family protein [Aliivibrio fischeri]|uniref:nucleotidyl transferase AbiEii/AbiGii toxin family protein n=1 Tax=Aliivibrio fischeri TaxID=668 RepID=UPI0012D8F3D7|nr:nucleotidyl transferase AbiEii/AbiGii toxin family protein [Aliivibrio fischeri]MUK26063.1 nucleotidyl transferase AbiEii/AbiGii toxin family protein [Aliivibrio fischeri]MUK33972.1 nucleotidyl transferase AbiEii/AbiGii toxin family protein [Aliivibrio fischeri]